MEDIIWTDEHLIKHHLDVEEQKHCKLVQSYGSYEKAYEAAYVGEKNPAIEHKTSTIIYKPTGKVLSIIIVK